MNIFPYLISQFFDHYIRRSKSKRNKEKKTSKTKRINRRSRRNSRNSRKTKRGNGHAHPHNPNLTGGYAIEVNRVEETQK